MITRAPLEIISAVSPKLIFVVPLGISSKSHLRILPCFLPDFFEFV